MATLRAQRDEQQELAKQAKQEAEQNYSLYLEAQEKHQSALMLYQGEQQKHQSVWLLYQEEQERSQTTLTHYQEAQAEAASYLSRYTQEQARTKELQVMLETVQTERQQYLTLYNEALTQLKFERRSKAGIKGWETRRKRENELLKREIADMAVLLRDSLERKDEAISHLEELAGRMDRIQILVDSVEGESVSNPVGFLQKMARIWQAIQDILAE